MASLRLKLSLSYLAALSVEVLELIDAHYAIAVSYQDTVCLCREEQVLHVDCGGGRLHYNWLPAEGHREDPPTRLVWLNQNQPTNQTQDRHKPTHMFKVRSQISSCLSLTAPNTVACLWDHLTSCTTPWMHVKVSRGRRWCCFHRWMVQSEEQLRKTSGLNGDQATAFTAHWGRQGKPSVSNGNKYATRCVLWKGNLF